MKDVFVMVLSGTGLLIFAYLLFKNAGGVNQLLSSGFSGADKTITVLQGR